MFFFFNDTATTEIYTLSYTTLFRSFHYGKGCEQCNNTGYRGRQGIYEIMLLDDEMRDLIIKHASTQILRHEAKKRGMRTLRQGGLLSIYDGVTSIEEVVRETIMEEN